MTNQVEQVRKVLELAETKRQEADSLKRTASLLDGNNVSIGAYLVPAPHLPIWRDALLDKAQGLLIEVDKMESRVGFRD